MILFFIRNLVKEEHVYPILFAPSNVLFERSKWIILYIDLTASKIAPKSLGWRVILHRCSLHIDSLLVMSSIIGSIEDILELERSSPTILMFELIPFRK